MGEPQLPTDNVKVQRRIKQFYVECDDDEEKFQALANVYGVASIVQAIVFCNTRRSAQDLADKMFCDGHAVALFTGESTIEQQIAVLNRFCQGKTKVLITTNLCVRGICMESVTLVVNYDIPMDTQNRVDCDTYVHRIRCMGHPWKTGLAISFVSSIREIQEIEQEIERHTGEKIMRLPMGDPDLLEKAVTSEL